ncbi:hypothetical protein ACVQD4_004922, partial [Citrobacter freundii]
TTRITGEKPPDEANCSCPSSYAQISANIEEFLPAMTGSITRKFFLIFWKPLALSYQRTLTRLCPF